DIQTTTDTGGGYNVSYIQPNEWIEYTTYINDAGVYNLKLRVASPVANNQIQINFGGTDATGTWTFPATGGYQTWTTITKTVFLTPGQHVMRLNMISNGFNLNWIELTPVSTGPVSNGTYKLIARHSGSAMDVINASTSNGAGIQQWGYAGSSNQKWTITHLGGTEYKILSAQTSKTIDEDS